MAAAGIYFLNMAVGAVCLGWNTGTVNTENFWYRVDHHSVLNLILSVRGAISVGNIISSSPKSSPTCANRSTPFSSFFGFLSSRISSRKYWLLNCVELCTHFPSNPLRLVWQRPRLCAPDSATISWSLNPIRMNTLRTWSAPFAPVGV